MRQTKCAAHFFGAKNFEIKVVVESMAFQLPEAAYPLIGLSGEQTGH